VGAQKEKVKNKRDNNLFYLFTLVLSIWNIQLTLLTAPANPTTTMTFQFSDIH